MITKETRISKLLDEFPQALDVLLLASPHFEKLKNPLLRRFAAPRASIADAARIGGVDLNTLLSDLNAACGCATTPVTLNVINEVPATPKPQILVDTPPALIVDCDVREDIARGEDPFKKIIGAVKKLREGEILHLINIFEPVPLYGVLERRGLAHWSECVDGVWSIYFYSSSVHLPTTKTPDHGSAAKENVITLDVSGLEPPEPMMKILSTLPMIGNDGVLVVHHHREPLMLYDKLTERGFVWTTTALNDGAFQIEIRVKHDA